MVRIILYRKLVARLLILAYLLIGLGIGNGLIWCQESEAFSHLEYNPSGKCQDIPDRCLLTAEQSENYAQALPTPLSWSSSAGCLDSPTSISHALSSRDKDFKADTAVPALASFDAIQVKNKPVARLSNLNLVAQPPPPQALTALRTIVLLN